jgi:hypothetical protein
LAALFRRTSSNGSATATRRVLASGERYDDDLDDRNCATVYQHRAVLPTGDGVFRELVEKRMSAQDATDRDVAWYAGILTLASGGAW